MEGYCKVKSCMNAGKWYKNLKKHLQREHKNLTWIEHKRLPMVKTKVGPPSMKYRYAEDCKLCGKSVLLLPHIKTIHKLASKVEYEKIVDVKNVEATHHEITALLSSSTSSSSSSPYNTAPSIIGTSQYVGRDKPAGLHSIACKKLLIENPASKVKSDKDKSNNRGDSEVNSCWHSKANQTNSRGQGKYKINPIDSDSDSDSPESPIVDDTDIPQLSWPVLRYYIHQLDFFKMVFIHHKIKRSIKNGDNIETLSTLLCNCEFLGISSMEDFKQIIYLRKHLMRYYCYPAFTYPYPRFQWTELCHKLQDPYPKSFYLYCRESCSDAFNCTKCKRWGKGYHVCWDFMQCSVCDVRS